MKEIKKTSWQYRLIDFTFEQESKSTCGFHLETLVAILALPVTLYQQFFLSLFPSIQADSELRASETNKNKWEELGLLVVLTVVAYFIFMLLTTLSMIPFLFILKTPNGELPCSTTALALYSLVGMIVFPLIKFGLNKVYAKLKSFFCKPITFVD